MDIKWRNDVLLNKYKIAGILQEGHLEGNKIKAVALGIGINVQITKRFFLEKKLLYASSLSEEIPHITWDKDKILKRFLTYFFESYKSELVFS